MRTCVGCRRKDARSVLVRVALTDGRLVVDESAVAPGRGAWLHPDRSCLSHATQRHAFSRAFRTAAIDASGLVEHPAFR
ncbi:YlxR family protein [Demequina sp. TTPB684]|nr:YlxR family protein [Demequina sp. TTPB684]